MSPDSQNQKPEWMQLTEGDPQAIEVSKASKKLPAIAVLITGAVIATGAFLANASESKNSQNSNSGEIIESGTAGSAVGISDTSTPSGIRAPGITKPNGDDNHQFGDGVPHPDDGDGDHRNPDGDKNHVGERHHDGDHGSGTAPKIPTATSTPDTTNSNS
jgi:hypothetical protein